MNTNEWIQHLASLTSSPYLSHMAQASAEFESLAYTISLNETVRDFKRMLAAKRR